MRCSLCQRESPTTKHHLIPKSCHTKKRKKQYGDNIGETIDICADCHGNIHAVFTEKELAEEYNTYEKLAENDSIRKFSKWIRKKDPNSRFHSKKSKR